MSPLADPDDYLRRTAIWTLGLGAGASALCAMVWDWQLALGVALGALLAHVNLMLLARTLGSALGRVTGGGPEGEVVSGPSTMSDSEPVGTTPPTDGDGSPEARARRESARVRAQGLFRLPLVVLALVLILWYMPARPEGVALGVVLSLASAVFAALRSENRRFAPTREPPA